MWNNYTPYYPQTAPWHWMYNYNCSPYMSYPWNWSSNYPNYWNWNWTPNYTASWQQWPGYCPSYPTQAYGWYNNHPYCSNYPTPWGC